MAIIEGGKVSEAAWLKMLNLMGVACIALGTIVWFRIEKALDKFDNMQLEQVRHTMRLDAIERDIQVIRAGKRRAEFLLPSSLGRIAIKGRGPGGKGEVIVGPKPPKDVADPEPSPVDPTPAPAPRPTDRRDVVIVPVRE